MVHLQKIEAMLLLDDDGSWDGRLNFDNDAFATVGECREIGRQKGIGGEKKDRLEGRGEKMAR